MSDRTAIAAVVNSVPPDRRSTTESLRFITLIAEGAIVFWSLPLSKTRSNVPTFGPAVTSTSIRCELTNFKLFKVAPSLLTTVSGVKKLPEIIIVLVLF